VNGGKRALVVSILLFLLWGTFVCAPFRNYVRALRWLADALTGILHVPAAGSALIITVLFLGITAAYLFVRSGKAVENAAIIAAIVGVLFHLYQSVIDRMIAEMAVPVVIGLMASMLFLLFQANTATLYLADAYFYAIPVYLFYELVMTPVFAAAGLRGNLLAPFITVGQPGLATDIGDLFGIPAWGWGTFLFLMTLLPVIYLSKGRAPAKRDLRELKL
jgi:hypothetical protein